MIKKCALFTMIFLLFAGIVSVQADSFTEGIVYITGQDVDARVKLRETPGGKIIGQYYAGAHYAADEEKDGWMHVTIGGRTGWMMSSYLQQSIQPAVNAPVGSIAYPEPDDCISLISLDGIEHRIPENTLLYVLGTVGETFVHVEAHLQDSEILYGDCIMEKISWSENLGHASVRSDRADLAINVREEPDINSKALYKLYPGTEVRLIFDYHNSGDGWHRIRNGSVSGYIRDDHLDFSTDGVSLLVPQWGMLKQAVAIVTGSEVGTVNQTDPLFVLGTAGNKNTPCITVKAEHGWMSIRIRKFIFSFSRHMWRRAGKAVFQRKPGQTKPKVPEYIVSTKTSRSFRMRVSPLSRKELRSGY